LEEKNEKSISWYWDFAAVRVACVVSGNIIYAVEHRGKQPDSKNTILFVKSYRGLKAGAADVVVLEWLLRIGKDAVK
jgi:hypothetical protein